MTKLNSKYSKQMVKEGEKCLLKKKLAKSISMFDKGEGNGNGSVRIRWQIKIMNIIKVK